MSRVDDQATFPWLGFACAIGLCLSALPAHAQPEADPSETGDAPPADAPAEPAPELPPVALPTDPYAAETGPSAEEPAEPQPEIFEEAEPAAEEVEEEPIEEDFPEYFEPNPALDEQVSVASRFTLPTQRAPAGVTVVTATEITNAGYRSVGEALAWVPGLFVSYDLLNYHVGARGLFGGSRSGSRNFRIMINGRPVAFVQSGTYLLGPEFVPIGSVERIEVMLGPASALYGAGALLGAINIVTRRPIFDGEVRVRARTQLDGGFLGQLGVGGDFTLTATGDGWNLLAAMGGAYEDRSGLSMPADSPFLGRHLHEDGGPGHSERDTAVPRSFLIAGDTGLGGGRLTVQIAGQGSERSAEFYDLTVLTHESRIDVMNLDASVSYERAFGSGYWLRGGVGFTYGAPGATDQFDTERTDGRLTRRRFSSQAYTAQLEFLHEFGELGLLLIGVDGQVDLEELPRVDLVDGAGNVAAGNAPPGRTLGDLGAYAQLMVPIDRLTLAAGIRYDYHSVIEHAISARAGATLRPNDQVSIKLYLGRSFRAPSPEQLYGNPLSGLDIAGDPTLPAQYLYSGEAIVDWFVTRDLRLVGTAYYNYSDDALAYVSEAGNLTARPFDAHSVGGELRARYAETYGDAFSLNATVAFSGQQTWTDQSILGGFPEKTVPDNESFPGVMALGALTARVVPWHIGLRAAYRYVSTRVPSQSNLRQNGTTDLRYPNYVLGDFHILDLGLLIGPFDLSEQSRLSFGIWGRNLIDQGYSQVGFNGVDVPSIGRTIWLRARLDL